MLFGSTAKCLLVFVLCLLVCPGRTEGSVYVEYASPLRVFREIATLLHSRAKRGGVQGNHHSESSACISAVQNFPADCASLLSEFPDLSSSTVPHSTNLSSEASTPFSTLCRSSTCLGSIVDIAKKCPSVTGHNENTSDSFILDLQNNTLAGLLDVGCAVNAGGQQCFEAFSTLSPNADNVSCAIPKDLSSTGHECSQECKQHVSVLADATGCCINSFHDTVIANNQLKQALLDMWNVCNVADPGMCVIRKSSSLSQYVLSHFLVICVTLLTNTSVLLLVYSV